MLQVTPGPLRRLRPPDVAVQVGLVGQGFIGHVRDCETARTAAPARRLLRDSLGACSSRAHR